MLKNMKAQWILNEWMNEWTMNNDDMVVFTIVKIRIIARGHNVHMIVN
jgi:hypothetical protein